VHSWVHAAGKKEGGSQLSVGFSGNDSFCRAVDHGAPVKWMYVHILSNQPA
jgi:hypothetical protein